MTAARPVPIPAPVGGGPARQVARAELAHPEYHRDRTSWTSRVVHWIGHRIDELFGNHGGSHALLLVVVVLLVVAILFALRAGLPKRRERRGTGDTDPDLLAPARAIDHRRLAEQLTADGQHSEALREWLRAAIASIEERGVLPPRPGRTGAATAREAAPLLPSAAEPLAAATRAFDEVWFGGRAATAADVAQGRAAAEAVDSARIASTALAQTLAVPR